MKQVAESEQQYEASCWPKKIRDERLPRFSSTAETETRRSSAVEWTMAVALPTPSRGVGARVEGGDEGQCWRDRSSRV